jgi:hypothetical protein
MRTPDAYVKLRAILNSNEFCKRYTGLKPCVLCGVRDDWMIENVLLSEFNNPQCVDQAVCSERARNRPHAGEVGRGNNVQAH